MVLFYLLFFAAVRVLLLLTSANTVMDNDIGVVSCILYHQMLVVAV